MVWYSHLFQNFLQFIVILTVKGFGIVNKAEIDVFLELSCFFDGPADVGNLISGSSAFSKTSLNIWKFTVHILLKAGLEKSRRFQFQATEKRDDLQYSLENDISLMLVAQSCPTLCSPMDCSPPGSFVHRILQARLQQYVNRELPDVQA